MGRKPFLVKISTLMQKSTKALEPFTTNSWEWSHDNMDKLWSELSDEDKEVFGFDIRDLDWVEYLEAYVQVKDFSIKLCLNIIELVLGNKTLFVQRRSLNLTCIQKTFEPSLLS